MKLTDKQLREKYPHLWGEIEVEESYKSVGFRAVASSTVIENPSSYLNDMSAIQGILHSRPGVYLLYFSGDPKKEGSGYGSLSIEIVGSRCAIVKVSLYSQPKRAYVKHYTSTPVTTEIELQTALKAAYVVIEDWTNSFD